MREIRSYGSVRGASGDRCPYRDRPNEFERHWRIFLPRCANPTAEVLTVAQPAIGTLADVRLERAGSDFGAPPGAGTWNN